LPRFHATNAPEDGHSRPVGNLPPDPDSDAVWRVAIGLDLEDRGVLEAEALLWRVCCAKSIPEAAIRRALCEEWESDGLS
jgi:hypothetical protein